MQKVVGSSPIIRSLESPVTAGFFYVGVELARGCIGLYLGTGAYWCPMSTLY